MQQDQTQSQSQSLASLLRHNWLEGCDSEGNMTDFDTVMEAAKKEETK